MLEEQDRELAHEVECEREIQRLPKIGALKPRLDDEVQQFITSGRLQQKSRRLNSKMNTGRRTHSLKDCWRHRTSVTS